MFKLLKLCKFPPRIDKRPPSTSLEGGVWFTNLCTPPEEGTGIYTSASRTIKASSCINQYFYLTVDLFTWRLDRSARLYPSLYSIGRDGHPWTELKNTL